MVHYPLVAGSDGEYLTHLYYRPSSSTRHPSASSAADVAHGGLSAAPIAPPPAGADAAPADNRPALLFDSYRRANAKAAVGKQKASEFLDADHWIPMHMDGAANSTTPSYLTRFQ